jgi:hypothetical protein
MKFHDYEKILLELGLKDSLDLSPITLSRRETDELINGCSYEFENLRTRFLTEGGAIIRLKAKKWKDLGEEVGGIEDDKYIVSLPEPQMDDMFTQKLYTYQQIIYEEALEVFKSKTKMTIHNTRIAQHLIALVEYDNRNRASIERRDYEQEVTADIKRIINIFAGEERVKVDKVIHKMVLLQQHITDSKKYQHAALIRQSIILLKDLQSIYTKNQL